MDIHVCVANLHTFNKKMQEDVGIVGLHPLIQFNFEPNKALIIILTE